MEPTKTAIDVFGPQGITLNEGELPELALRTNERGELAPVGEEVELRAGEKLARVRLPLVAELFRGTTVPPRFDQGPTAEYMQFFLSLEKVVLACSNLRGRDESDQELERVYSQLRRRFDSKDRNPLTGYLRAMACIYMLQHPTSRAQLEGVLTRLIKSARTFSTAPISYNYVATLRQSLE